MPHTYVCMYVCMCVYVCVCVDVCICVCIYVRVCMCVFMYVCTYLFICIYVYIYAYMCVYLCVRVYVYMCVYVCMYVCIYVHVFVCVWMYVCLCMYKHVCVYIYVCMSIYMYVCMPIYVCVNTHPFPLHTPLVICSRTANRLQVTHSLNLQHAPCRQFDTSQRDISIWLLQFRCTLPRDKAWRRHGTSQTATSFLYKWLTTVVYLQHKATPFHATDSAWQFPTKHCPAKQAKTLANYLFTFHFLCLFPIPNYVRNFYRWTETKRLTLLHWSSGLNKLLLHDWAAPNHCPVQQFHYKGSTSALHCITGSRISDVTNRHVASAKLPVAVHWTSRTAPVAGILRGHGTTMRRWCRIQSQNR